MKIIDRYASAVRSSNLRHRERTDNGDTDVLAAMGVADRELTTGKNNKGEPVHPAPLAVSLERLFTGDNKAAAVLVDQLAVMCWEKAKAQRLKLRRTEAQDMARACLAWHRDGSCKKCGGHGFLKIPGSTTLGTSKCSKCESRGKVPFESQFEIELVPIAVWLIVEMEKQMCRAGPRAMRQLASDMEM